jgi:hypothetical protein
VNELEDEGEFQPTYAPIIDRIFNTHNQKKLLQTDTEILLTNMYVFYVKKVFMGLTSIKPTKSDGFTRKMFHMSIFRFSLTDPNLLSKNENLLFSQYYKLREALKKYRAIERRLDTY